MNLKDEILREHSKAQAVRLSAYIKNDEAKFDELMQFVLSDDKRLSQGAAWVMSHCADKNPGLIMPYIGRMAKVLKNTPHVAVKRNIIRVLSYVKIPEVYQGDLVNTCFDILLNPKETIAVQSFSMTVIYNITLEQPDLQGELRVVIEDMLEHGSAGIKSRGKKILKMLS